MPLWIAGLVHLLRGPRFRLLGVAATVVMLVLLVQRAKSYYAGPVYPLLLAGGAISFERLVSKQASPRRRRWLVRSAIGALVVTLLAAIPIALPVLPVGPMVRYHLADLRTDYADMLGWPELAQAIAGAYRALPPDERANARVLASNYGEAGAVDWFGPRLGLPPAISGHDTFWFLRPRHEPVGPLVAVGYRTEELRTLCGDLRQVGTVINSAGAANEEQGGPIFVCRDLRMPLESWPAFRRFVS